MRSLLPLALLALAAAASAAPVLTFDTPTVSLVRPAAGNVIVDLYGTIDLNGSPAYFPTYYVGLQNTDVSNGSTTLAGAPVYSTSFPGGKYTGKLLSYTFTSTSPLGTYATSGAGVFARFYEYFGGYFVDTNAVPLAITLTNPPVPEPASLCALGLGAALLRRRQRA